MTDLRGAASEYLAVRRTLGFKLIEAERLLHQFLDYLEQQQTTTITIEIALAWATLPHEATAWWWRKRLGVVRGFARYLAAFTPSVEVPPAGLIVASIPRNAPYRYSEADLAALMHAAGELRLPLQQATYQTLLGLLAVTGMRVGEAIALDVGDVDLEDDRLVIRHGKFGKSRELMLHPTTTQALAGYLQLRVRHCPGPASAALLISTVGTRLHYPNVSAVFRRLVRQADLHIDEDGRRPRLHDLRHGFALRTVAGWYATGADVGTRLPLLSTYLGHTDPANTYWYLSSTPELLGLAAERLETFLEVSG
jgi:integrase/recombinase XerD